MPGAAVRVLFVLFVLVLWSSVAGAGARCRCRVPLQVAASGCRCFGVLPTFFLLFGVPAYVICLITQWLDTLNVTKNMFVER